MAGAFSGLRILDFSEGIAGPMACMLFADLGADVIKLESRHGDRMADHPGYLCWNRNKRSVVLDLDSAGGREAADALLASADAAVFDGRPGSLDAETLLARHPALLCLWMPPYGSHPGFAELPPDDGLLWGYAGAAFRQFSWEDVPVWLVTPQASYGHALLAADALAAGLYERAQSGRGQLVTVSGLHAMAALQGGHVTPAGVVEKLPDRGARGRIANYRMYRCGDGEWFFLATLIEGHFRAAVDAIGLASLWQMDGVENQFAHVMKPGVAVHVNRTLEARFAEQPRDAWLQVLRAAGVPCAPVRPREVWFESETIEANAMRVELEHAEHGTVRVPGVPLQLSDTPGKVRALAQAVDAETVLREERPAPPAPRPTQDGGPLHGIRVLDLGVIIAGTYAPAILGDLGADIIKVEPHQGDPFRPYGLGFVGFNRGKRSIALDLKHPEGRDAFFELVKSADVVCDNYRLGVLERLGIDYATLQEINPRIVQASVTAYGSTGPLATDPGFDPLLQAEGGLMAAQGGVDEPVFHQVAVHDTAGAMTITFGIIAALYARERSGRGQRVETSLAAQSILLQSGELTQFEARRANPDGDRDCPGLSALQRFYRCADGWIGLSCPTAQRPALERALELPASVAVAAAEADRLGRDGEVAHAIEAALQSLDRAQALEKLAAERIPALPALSPAEVYTHPWHDPSGFFGASEHPTFGTLTATRSFAEWTRTPGGFPRRAPLLGEHGAEILAEIGFSSERIAALCDARALRLPRPEAS
jgi:crotonobetainyl-CoA:carnitine CoA-transferase CaiB-like acyl-CoA transferase